MKPTVRSSAISLAFLLVGMVIATAVQPLGAGAQGIGNSGYIRRFDANWRTFGDPPEIVTNVEPAAGGAGGIVIYDKSFFSANDINTLYVTISAVGDTHNGAQLQLACLLDDVPCNPGPNPIGSAPPGWLTISRHKDYNEGDYELGPTPFFGDGGGGAGDLHDNSVNYTWCTPISGAGTHNVKVKMASHDIDAEDAGPPVVFLEAVHFFIDGSRIADETNACTEDTTEIPPLAP